MNGEVHISSIIVHSRPEAGEMVAAAIAGLPGAEVRAVSPAGKIVVVLEAESVAAILDCIETIRCAPGVISAALVFHGIDEPAGEEAGSSPCQ